MVELIILTGFLILLVVGDFVGTSFMFLINKFCNHSHMSYFQYLKLML